jgi:3-hydroxyisobutyrate dehydrogenase
MSDNQPKVAILGLGTMGTAMAQTMHRSAIPLVVWNRDPAAASTFLGTGVEIAKSVASAAERADVVITMVTNAEAVLSIANEHGLVEALRPGAVWAQMSTIGVEATEQLVTLLGKRSDVLFVDAPVSGSKVPAENGNLLIFGSGSDEARSLVQPVFDVIGQRTLWLGQAGNGSRMKLVNNVLLAFTAEGVANSLALAHRLGLETSTAVDAFDGGPLISAWESGKLSRISQGEYSAEFALTLALKDVRLALTEGGPERFMVLAALATEWQGIVDRGLGSEDVTVVTRALGE